jgi:hypothetical protein
MPASHNRRDVALHPSVPPLDFTLREIASLIRLLRTGVAISTTLPSS